jgi:hypothetical protein
MPRAPARRKTARVRRKAKPRPADIVWSLAFAMDEPLHDAINYVRALDLIGFGLRANGADDEADAIFVVARAASERLDTIKTMWRRLYKAAAEGRRG